MSFQYDVVVVGAGPVGLATACSIKTLNPNTRVVVLDKDTTSNKNYRFQIDINSLHTMQELFKAALEHHSTNVVGVESLNQFFQNWSARCINSTEMESDLAEKAEELGVTVCRGSDYEVKEDQIDSLCEGTRDSTKLQKMFKTAQVIIGADGRDSSIRKKVMQNQLTDQKPIGQWVELNYQTKENETVALHLAINPETFKKLKHSDDSLLTLNEMKEKGKTDEKIQSIYKQCESYFDNLNSRKETYHSIKTSTHEVNIFRSKDSFTTYKGKHVFLIGDAESVVALERGVNKGLKGAAICAYLVNAYFFSGKLDSIFFENYAEAIKDIFDKANECTPAKEPAPPSNCCVLL